MADHKGKEKGRLCKQKSKKAGVTTLISHRGFRAKAIARDITSHNHKSVNLL